MPRARLKTRMRLMVPLRPRPNPRTQWVGGEKYGATPLDTTIMAFCKAAPKQVRHAQEAHAHTFRNTQ